MQLPAPTGPWPIGTTTYEASDAKRGSAPDGTDTPRVLMIHAWYPASGTAGAGAPYLRDERAQAELRRNNPVLAGRLLVEDVVTHARLDAPVATISGGIPVLVFSHGYLSLPGDYTALMEDLASHGYAVFSITHPYETAATTIGGGRVATSFGAAGLNDVTRGVLAEWHDEDSVSAAVTGAADRASAERALRDYLGRIPKSTAALERWVEDTRVATDRIAALAAPGSGARLAGKLDLKRLGAFGHSMGGITSAAFCARDSRCRAAINLDGSPQYGDLIDHPGARPFLMVYSARPGRVGVSDLAYGRSDSAWRAVIDGTRHINFGDFQYREGPQRIPEALGPIAAERSTAIVHRLVREWFDQWLSGKRSPLLAGERVFEELSVGRIGG
jgi:predicted dienelactone hydrolase